MTHACKHIPGEEFAWERAESGARCTMHQCILCGALVWLIPAASPEDRKIASELRRARVAIGEPGAEGEGTTA